MSITKLFATMAVGGLLAGQAMATPALVWWSHAASLGAGGPDVVFTVQGSGITNAVPTNTTVEIRNLADSSLLYAAVLPDFWTEAGQGDGIGYQLVDAAAWNNLTIFTTIYPNALPVGATPAPWIGANRSISWDPLSAPPQSIPDYDINPNGAPIVFTVIPEPGAMMFLMIGAATLVYRRMRQRN